ncbi:hypothetical protein ACFE04_011456 [Oxalis oulophora]
MTRSENIKSMLYGKNQGRKRLLKECLPKRNVNYLNKNTGGIELSPKEPGELGIESIFLLKADETISNGPSPTATLVLFCCLKRGFFTCRRWARRDLHAIFGSSLFSFDMTLEGARGRDEVRALTEEVSLWMERKLLWKKAVVEQVTLVEVQYEYASSTGEER